ncbi:sugar phosphate nucleotidyltransferase [Streptacidiphilus sp. P02-A3a]|uniref:sugar phosphate nucleotidyltransferase n=1 Tax=Streptacidiphilus sp. P02-A3a TaxID=2704468 RepID=UPI0015FD1843|nr:sugar phosphate nucleotidyltransferase [Streptacidiphilus sp. P02-A3a]QMU73252.1 NTP transferase domain-containing protein [Streptacidiphilus sp. P02-A3a]
MSGGFVGLLPAAGRGTRLAPLRYPKELLPIVYEPVGGDGTGVRARAVAEYALASIAAADVERVLLVVAPWKLDVLNYFGDGRHVGLEIGYLYQEEARGLPHALDLARNWTRGEHVVFAMPDTVTAPGDALARLRERYLETGADLALAVFPTAEPERLGPVLLDGERVVQVLDKPRHAPVGNTWGAAIWSDAFADLLHQGLAELADAELADAGHPDAGHPDGGTGTGAEPAIGHFFDLAVRRGLKVTGVAFPGGAFEDAGTRVGIQRCLDARPQTVPAPHPDLVGADSASRT